MKKQTVNIIIVLLAAAAVGGYFFRDKIAALFNKGNEQPDGGGTGNGSTQNTGGGNGGSTPAPSNTYQPGQTVKSKVAQAYVRRLDNTTLAGPYSNGQYIGAYVADAGSQYQIICRGETGFVFKNEVTVVRLCNVMSQKFR